MSDGQPQDHRVNPIAKMILETLSDAFAGLASEIAEHVGPIRIFIYQFCVLLLILGYDRPAFLIAIITAGVNPDE